MRLFHRREETLNEKLLRDAGYSTESEQPREAADDEVVDADDDAGDEIVFTLDAPELTGSACEIVTLPDASVLVDEDAPDVTDVAEAVEQDIDPPYRASAVRQDDGFWRVTARPIQVEQLAVAGEALELTAGGGIVTYVVDGDVADPSRIPSRLTTVGEQQGDEYHVRATRLDGDLWEVSAEPL